MDKVFICWLFALLMSTPVVGVQVVCVNRLPTIRPGARLNYSVQKTSMEARKLFSSLEPNMPKSRCEQI